MLITNLSNNNELIAQDVEYLLLLLLQSQCQIGGEIGGEPYRVSLQLAYLTRNSTTPHLGTKELASDWTIA